MVQLGDMLQDQGQDLVKKRQQNANLTYVLIYPCARDWL